MYVSEHALMVLMSTYSSPAVLGYTLVSYVYVDVSDRSLVGLSLTYIISLTGMFQYVVRQSAEVENLVRNCVHVYTYTVEPQYTDHFGIRGCSVY